MELSDVFGEQTGSGDDAVHLQLFFDDCPPLYECTDTLEVSKFLSSQSALIHAELNDILNDFLWHRDPFLLEIVFGNDDSVEVKKSNKKKSNNILPHCIIPHLSCFMRVGENIQDEWFLYFLSRRITSKFPKVSARITDTDGEFLLIEAAQFLPDWVTPQSSVNRVFIRNGSLCLIPPGQSHSTANDSRSSNNEPSLSLSDALKYIKTLPYSFVADTNIQNALSQRLINFPNIPINESRHMINVWLPLHSALLLFFFPQLVSVAVHNLPPPTQSEIRMLSRDAKKRETALGVSESLLQLPAPVLTPVNSDCECVCLPLRLTRLQFAKLLHLNDRPPHLFSYSEWSRCIYKYTHTHTHTNINSETIPLNTHTHTQQLTQNKPRVRGACVCNTDTHTHTHTQSTCVCGAYRNPNEALSIRLGCLLSLGLQSALSTDCSSDLKSFMNVNTNTPLLSNSNILTKFSNIILSELLKEDTDTHTHTYTQTDNLNNKTIFYNNLLELVGGKCRHKGDMMGGSFYIGVRVITHFVVSLLKSYRHDKHDNYCVPWDILKTVSSSDWLEMDNNQFNDIMKQYNDTHTHTHTHTPRE
eukprot:GHVR01104930.1.p1 GENE.GHVR01104930.1~~GHVR01104930.1.p1  ORF type:complete len:586 (-),score=164.85 GHVR01104930.1:52-1809(-)